MENNKIRLGIGIMSGTSLDGLDLALVKFTEDNFEFISTRHFHYSDLMMESLAHAQNLPLESFFELENKYSKFIANKVIEFLGVNNQKPDFISCHGHTVFHQPKLGLTYQLCNGHILALETGIVSICDFRRGDVAAGGQGAPLVPIGDELLFGKYHACLNLGGFANISYQYQTKRIAYDICPTNLPMNEIARSLGKPYDDGGQMAKSGFVNDDVLQQLNRLNFYHEKSPKSLGREWVENEIAKRIETLQPIDALATLCEHAAFQIGRSIARNENIQNVLVTGGGTFNLHLIDRIRHYTNVEIIIPDKELINYKEALIFAFLGKLRLEGRINALKSVTGAISDTSSGVIYLPPPTFS